MPRETRIDVADHWYHVISRGQRREALFLTRKDYLVYLKFLNESLRRNGACLGGYCLMTNHVHLLVYRRSISLGAIFRQAHMNYAKYFNRTHRKTGYVFQGRFKSFLILSDEYLAVLLRYIHENPVRAKMVKSAVKYPWSSDAFYRSGVKRREITVIRVPGYEGRAGSRGYRNLMGDEEKSDFASLPKSGQIIGTEKQIERHNRRSRRGRRYRFMERRQRIDIERRLGELLTKERQKLDELVSASQKRQVSLVRSRMMGHLYAEGYPPSAIGRIFKRTTSTVIRAHERCV